MNFYPLCYNEISFPFIKFNVAINLPNILDNSLYYLKTVKLAKICSNE